jgi:SAM-dependent methyltransferase
MRDAQSSERRTLMGAALTALILILFVNALAQEPPAQAPLLGNPDRAAPFVPTPLLVVEKMLELAQVDKHDTVYDLGSGDGRIVIMAAEKFEARAVGVELDDELFKQSSARIAQLGLEKRAKILHANLFDTNLRHATVVTLYLLTIVNERLRPKLEKELRPGARIVSHDFQVPGWKPEKVETVNSENEVAHTLYLYVRP